MKKEGFIKEWIGEKRKFKNSYLIKGIPGIGNISHVTSNYLIDELKAELVLKIYSNHLPSLSLINDNSMVEEAHYSVYHKRIDNNDLLFLTTSYPPKNDYATHVCCKYLSELIKDLGVKEVITIAGIAYKEMPDEIKLHCAVNDESLKKKLKTKGLEFTGKNDVGLIIGSAGLLLTKCAEVGIPAFCILVSTWAHPKYVGVKESKKTITFLKEYLNFDVNLSSLNKDIKKLNKKLEQARKVRKTWNNSEGAKRYTG